MIVQDNSAILCAIAKNEGSYLAEWAVYHKKVGFDEIFVYENESDDDSQNVLRKLEQLGILHWKPWKSSGDGRVQKAAYADGLAYAKGKYKWIAFFDIDEFLYIPKYENRLKPFLKNYDYLDAIAINWSLFGTSNHVRRVDGFVTERFTRCAEEQHSGNRAVKTIAKSASLIAPNLHNHEFIEGAKYETVDGQYIQSGEGRSRSVNHDTVRLNHYFTKSEEEWAVKVARGRATKPTGHPEKLRTQAHFVRHNRNEISERSLFDMAPHLIKLFKEFSLDLPKCDIRETKRQEPKVPLTINDRVRFSYSQFSEDLIIETILQRSKIGLRPSGRYLDIGACWPIKYSKTYAFYQRGWSGLCIDPRPGYDLEFKKVRPRDKCLTLGVANESLKKTYFCFQNPAFNTFDVERAAKLEQVGGKGRTLQFKIPIALERVQKIAESEGLLDELIDFMSIAVEGLELDALQSIDFQIFRPILIVLDHKSKSVSESLLSHSYQYLLSKKYECATVTNQSMLFLDQIR